MTEIGFNLDRLTGLKNVKFEDLDKDKDGTISKEEYESLLNEISADSLEISTEKNVPDKYVNEDQQAVLEQEFMMEEALDEIKGQISIDFCGENSKYIADVAFDLKDYLEEFKTNYEGDVSGMAEAFKEVLPAKYEELKAAYLANDPIVAKSQVLDEIIERLAGQADESNLQLLGKFLEAEADSYIEAYEGDDLAADLKAHLEVYMSNEGEKLKEPIAEYQAFSDSLGAYVDSNEFEQLKEKTKEFIQGVLAQGLILRYGSIFSREYIHDENSMVRFFNEIKDAEDLRTKMEKIISRANNSQTLLEQIEAGLLTEADVPKSQGTDECEAAGETAQTDTSVYQVDASKIDIGCRTSEEEKSDVLDILRSDSFKNQFKLQIMENLAKQGVSFATLEATFNNVYEASIDEYYLGNLPEDSYYTYRLGSNTVKTRIYTNTITEDFTGIFNEKMTEAINKNNESDTDFDLNNIDTSEWGGALSHLSISKNIRETLEPQLQTEAQRMCEANGVEFSEWEYESILMDVYDRGWSVQDFLTNFQTEFSMWVYEQKY